MTLKEIKAKDSARDWYLQAGAARRFYVSYPAHTCRFFTLFGRALRIYYQVDFVMQPAFMDDFITKESMREIAEYYYRRQRNDRNFLKKLLVYWHQTLVKPFFDFNRRLDRTDLKVLSDAAFSKLFRDYSYVYRRLWQEAIFLDAYDYYGEIMFGAVQRQAQRQPGGRELEILLAPPRPSFLQRERLAVLALTEKIKKYPAARRRAVWTQPAVVAALKKLSTDFHWLANDLAGAEYLGPDYFGGQVRELLAKPAKLKTEQRMRRDLRALAAQKRKLFKKYAAASELLRLGDYLARLGNFRDERKTYNQMANARLIRFAREFERRYAWPRGTAEQLFFWELLELPHRPAALARLAKRRKQQPALYHLTAARRFLELFDTAVLAFSRELKIRSATAGGLKGQPAYAGLVRGVARIIKGKEDFKKLKPGEILIAPNTRPEYLPVMKIAGAIVSEEGGITCHAAITSRELRVPCLVGVQGVTEIIKDGDIIEVDARAGRINIIKRKR